MGVNEQVYGQDLGQHPATACSIHSHATTQSDMMEARHTRALDTQGKYSTNTSIV